MITGNKAMGTVALITMSALAVMAFLAARSRKQQVDCSCKGKRNAISMDGGSSRPVRILPGIRNIR